MFSENNILDLDIVCFASIYKTNSSYYNFIEYEILFDTHIDDKDIKHYFYNPKIYYKNYDILITGVANHTIEFNTGYTIIIHYDSKIKNGQKFIAHIRKHEKNIEIFLEDVQ